MWKLSTAAQQHSIWMFMENLISMIWPHVMACSEKDELINCRLQDEHLWFLFGVVCGSAFGRRTKTILYPWKLNSVVLASFFFFVSIQLLSDVENVFDFALEAAKIQNFSIVNWSKLKLLEWITKSQFLAFFNLIFLKKKNQIGCQGNGDEEEEILIIIDPDWMKPNKWNKQTSKWNKSKMHTLHNGKSILSLKSDVVRMMLIALLRI